MKNTPAEHHHGVAQRGLMAVWFMGQGELHECSPNERVALLSITDPGRPSTIGAAGWGMFFEIGFADGEYDESVMRLMGAEQFRSAFRDYFDARRAQSIRRFVAQAVQDEGIDELYIHEPKGVGRCSAVGLWAARQYSAALRPELADIPNELVLVLLEQPEAFEEKLRIAERRAQLHFVSDQAPEDELSLNQWVQRQAEQWLVGAANR